MQRLEVLAICHPVQFEHMCGIQLRKSGAHYISYPATYTLEVSKKQYCQSTLLTASQFL